MTRTRGFTIIEAMVALVVLAVGLLGLASIQVVAVKAASIGASMQKASALATDLLANMQQWDYNDARLNTTRTTITSTSDAAVATAANDTSRAATPNPTPDFGEPSSGATTNNALTLNGTVVYQGLTAATLPGNTKTINRYWNVFPVQLPNGSTVAQGKLIQVIVRWTEQDLRATGNTSGAGYRQLVFTTYKTNPGAMTQ